jgi:hypothetical protein
MKQIAYFRDGAVVIFENQAGVALRYGAAVWRNALWVVTDDVFKAVQQQNQDVKFAEKASDSK